MSYMPSGQYIGDFVLKTGGVFRGAPLLLDGNLRVEPHSTIISEVKFINSSKSITLEEHSFIYHLHMMNGGEIHIKGEHAFVDELLIDNRVTLHIPKKCTDWRNFFVNISNESLITVVLDD